MKMILWSSIISAIAFLLIMFRAKTGRLLWDVDRVDISPDYPGGWLWCGTTATIVGLLILGCAISC